MPTMNQAWNKRGGWTLITTAGQALVLVLAAAFGAGCAKHSKSPAGGQGMSDNAGATRTQRSDVEVTTARGFLSREIERDGERRRYVVYVPREYDPSGRWPMIVFLHGRGESGTDGSLMLAQGLPLAIMRSPQRWPAVVVIPQKPTQAGLWADEAPWVMAMVEREKAAWSIDEDRLLLTGLSQGGAGTWAIGAMYADRWAALAPICGFGDPGFIGTRVAKLPIWAVHGDADAVIPVAQTLRLVDAARRAGGGPVVSVLPGVGHDSWTWAYGQSEFAEWLLAQRRVPGLPVR
ncbi:MAG: hypothetical protein ACK48N_04245 [Planctomyces sp.]|jgi:predicted peptidase